MRRQSRSEGVPAGAARPGRRARRWTPMAIALACVLLAPAAPVSAQTTPAPDANEPTISYGFLDLDDPCAVKDANGISMLTFVRFDDDGAPAWTRGFDGLEAWRTYARQDPDLDGHKTEQIGWMLCDGNEDVFWHLQAILYLCPEYRGIVGGIESKPTVYDRYRRTWWTPGIELTNGENHCFQPGAMVYWNPNTTAVYDQTRQWHRFPALVGLAHELVHAYQRVVEDEDVYARPLQMPAMKAENLMRYAFYRKVPGNAEIRPRPGSQGYYRNSKFEYYFDDIAWRDWSPNYTPLLDVFEEE